MTRKVGDVRPRQLTLESKLLQDGEVLTFEVVKRGVELASVPPKKKLTWFLPVWRKYHGIK